jgi:hypothetical protein
MVEQLYLGFYYSRTTRLPFSVLASLRQLLDGPSITQMTPLRCLHRDLESKEASIGICATGHVGERMFSELR